MFKEWKKKHYKLCTSDGMSFYHALENSFGTACRICNVDMIKCLLGILNNYENYNDNKENNFDINNIFDVFSTLGSAPRTPLMHVVTSEKYYVMYDRYHLDYFYDVKDHDPVRCLGVLLSDQNIDMHRVLSDTYSPFMWCVEQNKVDLVQCFINNWNNNNNGSTTNSTNGRKTKTNSDTEMRCLEIAARKSNVEMANLLIKNIHNMFTIEQISRMCQNVLNACVDGSRQQYAYKTVTTAKFTNPSGNFYDVFVMLLTAPELIKNAQTGERFIVANENIVDACLSKLQFGPLKYLINNKDEYDFMTQAILDKIDKKIIFTKNEKTRYDKEAAQQGCWSGNANVLMADGTYKQCKDIKVGDMVATLPVTAWSSKSKTKSKRILSHKNSNYNEATVTCTVVYLIEKEIEMCNLSRKNNSWITFEHPMLMKTKNEINLNHLNRFENTCTDDDDIFSFEISDEMRKNIQQVDTKSVNKYGLSSVLPKQVKKVEMIYQKQVYNFILNDGHCIFVDGHWCCTLAHDLKGNGIEHPFWGNSKAVQSYLISTSVTSFPYCVIN